MITTLFFLLLASFELVYISSKQQRKTVRDAWLQKAAKHPVTARTVAGLLIVCSLICFILKYGIASGSIAGVLTLMSAGSLVILLQPFNYLRAIDLAGLFALFFLLEIII